MRLFVDMDGTLARFHDVDKKFIEAMWTPTFYSSMLPFENMVEGLKRLISQRPDVEVYLLSAVLDTDPPFVMGEKNEWLDRYLPELAESNRIFTRAGTNKADYIGEIGKGDFLLDDYNKNLHEFAAAGGRSIKFRNDVNHQGRGAYGGEAGPLWAGDMVSYDSSPDEIAEQLSAILAPERTRGASAHSRGLGALIDAAKKKVKLKAPRIGDEKTFDGHSR